MGRDIGLVGAGNIGFRHLEGIVGGGLLEEGRCVHIVEPIADQRERFEARLTDAFDKPPDRVWHRDLQGLPPSLLLLLDAGPAPGRIDRYESYSKLPDVSAILLEKVVFSKPEDHDREFFRRDDLWSRTYINTPRRLWPAYRHIADRIDHEKEIHLSVNGSQWGLACNGVHFADLYSFLTGATELEFVADRATHFEPSKRPGYHELFGTVSAQSAKGGLVMTCSDSSGKSRNVTIQNGTASWVLDEAGGTVLTSEGGAWTESTWPSPYQSRLTGDVVASLESGQSCGLPTLRSANAAHRAFLEALRLGFERLGLPDANIT